MTVALSFYTETQIDFFLDVLHFGKKNLISLMSYVD